MIARGAMGNPWIFAEIKAAIRGEEWTPPTVGDVIDVLVDHVDRQMGLYRERLAITRLRRQMACYLKGFPGASALRQAIFQEDTRDGVVGVLRAFADTDVAREPRRQPAAAA
jgi:tRNA-dihydrouridine synthase B